MHADCLLSGIAVLAACMKQSIGYKGLYHHLTQFLDCTTSTGTFMKTIEYEGGMT
jgi:hypothetical protein